ncbi:MAG: 2-C-methyl-D-erythritol 2,4-cyclodiphosphate synthase [Erysipelotrichaceae bacterium]|jgi:2-C-methyl-D-erythritol 2,4-cyclodiphosphate synthase|nr:2-C-methyl-D-erythritol 2,4-cyclodiphosphate synthase [Erysipelotrichaceae bacterium]
MRIGQSTDIHPFAPNRKLILGGVEIEYDKGLAGHSDADALTHAIAESILGALGLGDLGSHFSDKDPKYKDICSLLFLQHCRQLLLDYHFQIQNIDSLVLIEEPKLAPYIKQMKKNIADALQISPTQVNIKATRGEGLGFVGRKEGVVAQAICLLEEE